MDSFLGRLTNANGAVSSYIKWRIIVTSRIRIGYNFSWKKENARSISTIRIKLNWNNVFNKKHFLDTSTRYCQPNQRKKVVSVLGKHF